MFNFKKTLSSKSLFSKKAPAGASKLTTNASSTKGDQSIVKGGVAALDGEVKRQMSTGAGELLDSFTPKSLIAEDPGIRMWGYLEKKKVKVGSTSWHSRYFVLNEHTLVYYDSSTNTDSAKGDILLRKETKVDVGAQQGHPYCLLLSSPSIKTVCLAATSEEERDAWREALEDTIGQIDLKVRGYLYRRGALGWVEKYYILQEEGLTCHDSHLTTARVMSTVPIRAYTTIQWNERALTFHILTPGEEPRVGSTFKCDSKDEWQRWHDFLKDRVLFRQSQDAGTEILLQSYLGTRPEDGREELWKPFYYTLTRVELTQYENEGKVKALEVWPFDVNCTVFETSLQPRAFQLVTSSKAFHGQGRNKDDLFRWIQTMREIIGKCCIDPTDALCREAMKKEDDFYEVVFKHKKPLGIVLERSANWAIVKQLHHIDSKVQTGSPISYINTQSAILSEYEETTQLLSHWQPPLVLGFRVVPTMEGWLRKQSRNEGTKLSEWKLRYFKLNGGHFKYYNSEAENKDVRGDVKLMGCAVSLVPHSEVPQYFCVRLVSGLTTLILQAANKEEMMEWAVALYHAVAIANGGGYLLHKERQRLEKEEVSKQQALEEEEVVEAEMAPLDSNEWFDDYLFMCPVAIPAVPPSSTTTTTISPTAAAPPSSPLVKTSSATAVTSSPSPTTTMTRKLLLTPPEEEEPVKPKKSLLVPVEGEEEAQENEVVEVIAVAAAASRAVIPESATEEQLLVHDNVKKGMMHQSASDEEDDEVEDQNGGFDETFSQLTSTILSTNALDAGGREREGEGKEDSRSTTTPYADIIRSGYLGTRPSEDGLRSSEEWLLLFYTLSSRALTQYSDERKAEPPLNVYHFNVNCAIFKTNLHPFSFQLVTSGKILHGQGKDKEETLAWVTTMRGMIAGCKLNIRDALCREAMKIGDEFYEVTFKEKKPFGIVLERAGDWGLIKLSQSKDSSIQVGSALSFINNSSVILSDYSTTTELLTGWTPPLILSFRKTPTLSGWLKKQSHTLSSKTGKHKWMPRYFRLAGGHLQYFDTEDPKEDIKGDIKLMGSAVSLLHFSEVIRSFAFRVMTGLSVLTMQAKSKEEMMHWATLLYHAVAIANGGGYLLIKERMELYEAEKKGAVIGAVQRREEKVEEIMQQEKIVKEEGEEEHLQHQEDDEEEEEEEEKEGDDEHEDQEEEVERGLFKLLRKAALNALVDGEEKPSPPLTEEQITFAFLNLNMGYTGQDRNMLRPIHFCHFIRIVTGKQNLFFEMDTFHKHFDKENNGFVNLQGFQEGVHGLEASNPKHPVIAGLKAFVRHSLISL